MLRRRAGSDLSILRLASILFVSAILLCVVAAPVHAEPALSEAAERSDAARPRIDLRGMGHLFPLRLHLVHGGRIDGALGGVDLAADELLLVRPRRSFRVHFSLIEAVTPRAQLLPPGEDGQLPAPPLISDSTRLKLRWRPTWRSHLGAVMSFVVPGTGQFIQEDEVGVGILFLVSDLFFITAAVLAFVGPSNLRLAERRAVGGTFVALALSTSILSSVHAFRAGRVRAPKSEPRSRP